MKNALLILFVLVAPSLGFSESFVEVCKKINPVTNQFEKTKGMQTCTMMGIPYQYRLSQITQLNSSCESEAAENYATVAADNFASAPREKEKSWLVVTCWEPKG